MVNRELGERKLKILQAIVDDYIKTAEPVGSRTISKHYLDLSSATIRNEMADLEEMGYLDKPHTSAGRIPSQRGYRLYVDSLMQEYIISLEEMRKLHEALQLKVTEFDTLIEEASDIISDLTRYTAFLVAPKPKHVTINNIKLIRIDQNSVLCILVIGDSIIKNYAVRGLKNVKDEKLEAISSYFSKNLGGKTQPEINPSLIEQAKRTFPVEANMIQSIFDYIEEVLNEDNVRDVYLGGTSNIFNYPEYKNIDKAREFLSFIENKQNVCRIARNPSGKITITIGRENPYEEMYDCSLIVSNYNVGDKLEGCIGVIGPTRMNYSRVVSLLECITDRMNYILNKLFFNE